LLVKFVFHRAEQLASVAPSLDQLIKSKQPSFKRKLRSKFSDKRSRSVSSIHHLKEDSLFGIFFVLFYQKTRFYCHVHL
jgi:hypothetical protein